MTEDVEVPEERKEKFKQILSETLTAIGFTLASGVGFWLAIEALITGDVVIKYEAVATASENPIMFWSSVIFGFIMGGVSGLAAVAYWVSIYNILGGKAE